MSVTTVEGKRGADNITINSDTDGIHVSSTDGTVDIQGTQPGDQLIVEGLQGNDTITVGVLQPGLLDLTLDGGAGNDTLIGSQGNDTLIGGSGNDTVTGGRGNDVAQLGSGNDTFIWNPGDGSDTVDGGIGSDTLQFNGSNVGERMDIAANGSHVLLHRDVGNVSMDLTGIETLNLSALAGADTITVNDLTGTDVKTVNVDLSADGQSDNVIVGGAPGNDAFKIVTSSTETVVSGLAAQTHVVNWDTSDTVTASGGAGDDTFDVSGLSAGGPHIALAGGAGDDTAILNGSKGADTITFALLADANPADTEVQFTSSTGATGTVSLDGVEQFVMNGGSGDDQMTLAQGPNPSLVHFTLDGGAGNDILQGGDGADTLIGGSGNDTVTGGRGNDVAALGAGNDTFIWNPGDGSDSVDGGTGSDTLQFNGSNVGEKMDISANGSDVRFFRDVGNVTMDVTGTEHINVADQAGTDLITVNDLTGTDVKDVNIDLTPVGPTPGSDTVVVNGTGGNDEVVLKGDATDTKVLGLAAQTHLQHGDNSDTLHVQGGAGDDTIDASKLLSGGPKLILDGGDGNDRLVGTAGDDVLLGGAGDDTIVAGGGHDIIDGGSGNNTIVLFDASLDQLDLRSVAAGKSYGWVMEHGHDVNGNVMFDFGTEHLTLQHETLEGLTASDFLV